MNDYSFEELKRGLTESFDAEITEEMLDSFRELTGDINPLHNDPEYAKEKGFDDRVCYGMLTASLLSTLGGVYLPGKRCLIHSVETNFLKPVFPGDRLTVKGTVYLVDEEFHQVTLKTEIFKQDGKKVLLGKMKVGVLD